MATPGSKWVCSKSTIVTSLKRHRGRISYASRDLNVCHQTLNKRIREDEELVQLLEDVRNEFSENMLDDAESVLNVALLKKDSDMANALKSAFYILNNKGLERGYSPRNNPNNNVSGGLSLDELKDLSAYIADIEKVS